MTALFAAVTALWARFLHWLRGSHCHICNRINNLDVDDIADLFAAFEHQLAGGQS